MLNAEAKLSLYPLYMTNKFYPIVLLWSDYTENFPPLVRIVCVSMSHLSATVVVSSCLDKDLQLRLISMPSLGSWPLFLFSCSLSLSCLAGVIAGEGSWKVSCVSDRYRECVCVSFLCGGSQNPPGVCFSLVMRGNLCVCEPEILNATPSFALKTHTSLADKYNSYITRWYTTFS